MAYRALLVCNWDYEDPEDVFVPLKGPRNDQALMERTLLDDRYGLFEVEKRGNLSWAELRQAFAHFLANAMPNDNLLLYFSGHGDRLQDGRLALCGVDTNSRPDTFAASSFDTKELREWIENANRAPSTLVILDCCYAGAMKGGLTEGVIAESLGTGTMVLSSGGIEPARDADQPDEPSPFTAALSEILLDPDLLGDANGMVSVDEVYQRLITRDPPLRPAPKRNLQTQGTFAMARRELRVEQRRPPLKGWQEPEIDTVMLTFDQSTVTASGAGAGDSEAFELISFDEHRRSAIRRISQLADAIVRATEYEDDKWAQRAVRRAWNCVGTTLFETALPPPVRNHIRELADRSVGARLLKVQLCFEDDSIGRVLELYPWEYLYRDPDPGDDADAVEPEPMALTPGLLVERVIHASLPSTLESRIQTPTTVGLVSSLRGTFGEAAGQIADGLTTMAEVNSVFDLRGRDAVWGDFLDAVEQFPELLVVFAPVRRHPQGVEVGFWSDDANKPDWHPARELVEQLGRRAIRFNAVMLLTFASKPGRDAVRATAEIARIVAAGDLGPVVFVCHAPGYAKHVPVSGQDSFPVLFVDAVTRGERFDHAVYYAKNRVAGRGSLDARRTFGVPGYYIYERVETETVEPKTGGQSPRSPSARSRSSGRGTAVKKLST